MPKYLLVHYVTHQNGYRGPTYYAENMNGKGMFGMFDGPAKRFNDLIEGSKILDKAISEKGWLQKDFGFVETETESSQVIPL